MLLGASVQLAITGLLFETCNSQPMVYGWLQVYESLSF